MLVCTFDSLVDVSLVSLLDMANDLLCAGVDGGKCLARHRWMELVVDENLKKVAKQKLTCRKGVATLGL